MLSHRSLIAVVTAAAIVAAFAGCSSDKEGSSATITAPAPRVPAVGAAPWPPPPDAMARARAAGLKPKGFESLQHHVHAHLDVFIDGVHQVVPAGIGINIKDPAVKTSELYGGPAYGGIRPPCKQACISPLHTHTESGILHTESPVNVDNTLGEFYIEWGVTLTKDCVGGYCEPEWPIAVHVNGKPFTGDPNTIALTDQKQIAIVIGKPPAAIPATSDFTKE